MKRTALTLTLALAIAAFTGCGKNEANMHEGKWKMTLTTKMQGLNYPIPPLTYTNCLTKENMNPQQEDKNKDCRQTGSSFDGDTYTWTTECGAAGAGGKISGTITFSGDTFEGSIDTTVQSVTMKQKITGSRIGDCPK